MSGARVYVVSLFLLFGNAFFVGAEFAAMAVRRSAPSRSPTPKQAGGHEHRGARASRVDARDRPAGHRLWDSVPGRGRPPPPVRAGLRGGDGCGLGGGVALAVALLIVSYLHVVVGEMIPRTSPSPAWSDPRCCSGPAHATHPVPPS